MVKDVSVVSGEACLPQHKLLLCKFRIKQQVKQMTKTFVSKCKVWKLNDDRAKIQFSEKVHAKAMARCDADVESMWKELKECLLEVSDEVCGRTKGLPRHRETWWWNEAVARAVKEKRRMYKIWYKSRTERDRLAYCWTRKLASKAVFEAKEAEM